MFIGHSSVEVKSWDAHHEDEAWLRFQCERAKAARTTFSKPVTNDTMTVAQLLSLVGKCNATPIDRFPAAQVRLVNFSYGVQDFNLNQVGFIAHLEYSPLGWPEKKSPAGNSPAYIVSVAGRGLGEAEKHCLAKRLLARKPGDVFVVDGAVTLLPIQPPCPYELADLNVLWAKD